MNKIELIKLTILKKLPYNLVQTMQNVNFEKIEEIRIRANKPVILKMGINELILKYEVTTEEIINILQNFCDNSIYTYQNQICSGFLTIPGGHRIGISGSCVIKEGKVTNINNLYSLNIRIAKEIKDCSNIILPYVINSEQKNIYNTLIVSSPGAR